MDSGAEASDTRKAVGVIQGDPHGTHAAHGETRDIGVLRSGADGEEVGRLHHNVFQNVVVVGVAMGGIAVAAAVGLGHYHGQVIAPYQQLNDAFADIGRGIVTVAVEQI